jgi:hypothetical protein
VNGLVGREEAHALVRRPQRQSGQVGVVVGMCDGQVDGVGREGGGAEGSGWWDLAMRNNCERRQMDSLQARAR